MAAIPLIVGVPAIRTHGTDMGERTRTTTARVPTNAASSARHSGCRSGDIRAEAFVGPSMARTQVSITRAKRLGCTSAPHRKHERLTSSRRSGRTNSDTHHGTADSQLTAAGRCFELDSAGFPKIRQLLFGALSAICSRIVAFAGSRRPVSFRRTSPQQNPQLPFNDDRGDAIRERRCRLVSLPTLPPCLRGGHQLTSSPSRMNQGVRARVRRPRAPGRGPGHRAPGGFRWQQVGLDAPQRRALRSDGGCCAPTSTALIAATPRPSSPAGVRIAPLPSPPRGRSRR